MNGMSSYLGIILGAAGLVVGIVALLVASEITKRTVGAVQSEFASAKKELGKSLTTQDVQLRRMRMAINEFMTDVQGLMEGQKVELDTVRNAVATLQRRLDPDGPTVASAVPSDEDRGFGPKAPAVDGEGFELASPV